MSGIAALYMRTTAAVDPRALERMREPLRARGGDDAGEWSGATVVVSADVFHTTPESIREHQPRVDPSAGVVVALDGRLDNREDLQAALRGVIGPADGDAAYVAAAYARWGTAAAEHLVGDFAFIVWDARVERLLCARDVMGVRPLFYGIGTDGALVVASDLSAILLSGIVSADINDARALEHLVDRGQDVAETLYRDVRRVPPGHQLVATRSAVTARRYWDFNPARAITYSHDREYVEHAREVLGRAVRAQARAVGRVGILLSGGIDSSSVASLASDAGVDCETFTTTFEGAACDESAQASAMAASCGFRWRAAPYTPKPQEWYEAQAFRYQDLPDYPNGAMLDDARAMAREEGVRVLLTGAGGDEWFTGSPYRYADWFAAGKYARAMRALAADVRVRGWRAPAREAVLCGAWPVLPSTARHAIKRVLGRRDSLPPWIPEDAAAHADVLRRVSFRVVPRDGETFAQADVRMMATGGFRIHSDEIEDRAASRSRVEQRNPMYDRRVVEFAYALPDDQRCRGTVRKFILRAAAGSRLAPVRARRDKAEFSDTYLDALAGADATFPRMTERGWIDGAVIARMQHDARVWRRTGDERFWGLVGPLWMCHALETWLAATSRRPYGREAAAVRAERPRDAVPASV